jgi:hypothetical protein
MYTWVESCKKNCIGELRKMVNGLGLQPFTLNMEKLISLFYDMRGKKNESKRAH